MRTKYYSKKGAKYHSQKVTRNGITFDSTKEANRYNELLLLQRAGAIQDLKRQVAFELIPAQYEEVATGEYYKRGERKGQPKIKRVCVEQSVVYNADFVYYVNGKMIVEDTKSEATRTKDYIIKRKMLLYFHKIRIKET